MSKSILKKGFLVLVIIVLSGTLLTGCFGMFNGTVTVNLIGDPAAFPTTYTYNIFVDDEVTPAGTITETDTTLVITDLSMRTHIFKATGTIELVTYEGQETLYVLPLWPNAVEILVTAALE